MTSDTAPGKTPRPTSGGQRLGDVLGELRVHRGHHHQHDGDRHCHYEPVNVGTGDPDAHRHHQGARA